MSREEFEARKPVNGKMTEGVKGLASSAAGFACLVHGRRKQVAPLECVRVLKQVYFYNTGQRHFSSRPFTSYFEQMHRHTCTSSTTKFDSEDGNEVVNNLTRSKLQSRLGVNEKLAMLQWTEENFYKK
ncbi:ATP-dependent DNA helicase Q-like 3 isoform X4 [Phaseolus vulgaris]|uniref:ATP-dependent DNA helicase Q-like 3 isoform X4 n=1 Tax=Phaseolus vulgaris TaxID=3885 RepID=UPI0035C94975